MYVPEKHWINTTRPKIYTFITGMLLDVTCINNSPYAILYSMIDRLLADIIREKSD